jgi:Flp pilus assembly protein TadD
MAQPITVGEATYQVNLKKREVVETFKDGKKTSYPLLHTLGGKNVYYFLTPLEKGKLQVLPVAFRLADKTWFNTTASMLRHFHADGDTPLEWRDSMLTFNTACFSCHVSQLEKNYDLKHESYKTVWREPGISCETCHGPAEKHNTVCRALPKGQSPTNLFLKSWRTFTSDQIDSSCATCHAKMIPLTPSFIPGETYFDHYDLVTLEDRDFSADGRDLGENYTYTLWLMNPCAKKSNLNCVSCHTSSGRYRFAAGVTNDVNAACSSCHSDRVKNIKAHSRHAPEGKAGACIACHMPMTSFAAMRRSDHSQRPPCPEAAKRYGAKSACILCHDKKDETWAAEKVREWFPDDQRRKKMLRIGELIDPARKRVWKTLPEMLAYLQEPASQTEEVVCASLVRLFRDCPDARIWPVVRQALSHPSALVRGAAAGTLAGNLRDSETVAVLCRALNDPIRVVRIQAAQSLAAFPRTTLDKAALVALAKAEEELLGMLTARPDDWASHYNLGNYRMARGDFSSAMDSYKISMKLRGDTIMPFVNAAVLASQQGNLQEAISYLRQASTNHPEHGPVHLNLGLALAETGDLVGAEKALRIAMKDPSCAAQAAYNCAVLVGQRNPSGAVQLLRFALEREPQNARFQEALRYYESAGRRP